MLRTYLDTCRRTDGSAALRYSRSPKSFQLLIDTTSIFDFWRRQTTQEGHTKPNISYRALDEVLTRECWAAYCSQAKNSQGVEHPNYPNTTHSVFGELFASKKAFISIDPRRTSQQKFSSFLKRQLYDVEVSDFRDAFVIPEGRDCFETVENPSTKGLRGYQRLSSRLSYAIGRLSPLQNTRGHDSKSHIVVVSDAFDLHAPLYDYASSQRGGVTLAFFRGGLEKRWHRAGLFNPKSAIQFLDLDQWSEAILGTTSESASHEELKGGHHQTYFDPLS